MCTVQYLYQSPRGTAACCINLTICEDTLPIEYSVEWSHTLLRIRGRTVSYLGLETSNPDLRISGFECESLQYETSCWTAKRLNSEAMPSFETSETDYPTTQHHIPEDRNPSTILLYTYTSFSKKIEFFSNNRPAYKELYILYELST
jgi:hypothetical protein